MMTLPPSWQAHLADEIRQPYFAALSEYIGKERREHEIYPTADRVYAALALTPFDGVRAVLLGQDPYHGAGQAHGLCFSVMPGVRKPPSLVNIHKELNADLGCPIAEHGCLASWSRNGVLMLNTVLSVRAGKPASHKGKGWERFTDAIISRINERSEPVVFLLWGKHALAKQGLIDTNRHAILEAPHPSPLAGNGFAGCRHFSKTNALLAAWDKPPIDWRIPETVDLP